MPTQTQEEPRTENYQITCPSLDDVEGLKELALAIKRRNRGSRINLIPIVPPWGDCTVYFSYMPKGQGDRSRTDPFLTVKAELERLNLKWEPFDPGRLFGIRIKYHN